MSIALLFWIIMVVWLLFGLWSNWPTSGKPAFASFGGLIILWVLLALLGWKVFGAAIHQ